MLWRRGSRPCYHRRFPTGHCTFLKRLVVFKRAPSANPAWGRAFRHAFGRRSLVLSRRWCLRTGRTRSRYSERAFVFILGSMNDTVWRDNDRVRYACCGGGRSLDRLPLCACAPKTMPSKYDAKSRASPCPQSSSSCLADSPVAGVGRDGLWLVFVFISCFFYTQILLCIVWPHRSAVSRA